MSVFIVYLKHMYLKHTPSFGDSGSSIIYLQYAPSSGDLAILVHCTSTTHHLIWQFRVIIHLQHAPSFGDSGSSYVLNTAPHVAIPSSLSYIHNTPCHWRFLFIIYLQHPLIWRFRFVICLRHGPSFGDSVFIIYLKHALSFGDPGISYILNTPLHLAILVHHISTTLPAIGDSGPSYIYNTPPHRRFRFIIC